MTQPEFPGLPDRLPPAVKVKGNPCIAQWGTGPDGKTCKDCVHLVRQRQANVWYKCRLRRNTHGRGTDHRTGWPACGKFEGKA